MAVSEELKSIRGKTRLKYKQSLFEVLAVVICLSALAILFLIYGIIEGNNPENNLSMIFYVLAAAVVVVIVYYLLNHIKDIIKLGVLSSSKWYVGNCWEIYSEMLKYQYKDNAWVGYFKSIPKIYNYEPSEYEEILHNPEKYFIKYFIYAVGVDVSDLYKNLISLRDFMSQLEKELNASWDKCKEIVKSERLITWNSLISDDEWCDALGLVYKPDRTICFIFKQMDKNINYGRKVKVVEKKVEKERVEEKEAIKKVEEAVEEEKVKSIIEDRKPKRIYRQGSITTNKQLNRMEKLESEATIKKENNKIAVENSKVVKLNKDNVLAEELTTIIKREEKPIEKIENINPTIEYKNPTLDGDNMYYEDYKLGQLLFESDIRVQAEEHKETSVVYKLNVSTINSLIEYLKKSIY